MTDSVLFLGVDVGSSKTHAVLADASGRVVGFGESGSGNHENVGWAGLSAALQASFGPACQSAGAGPEQVAGAGFGISGLDWPSQLADHLACIASLGLRAPVLAVNDALLGLPAGSKEGWGVAVVSGTGCNCWGWDRTRIRVAQMTGGGQRMGEAAGGAELVARAMVAVAQAWSGRGPATALSQAFTHLAGASSPEDLLEGLMTEKYTLSARAAPLVFETAYAGDRVAGGVVEWAGCELGEMVKSIVRRLKFQALDFDLVMVGSMFRGGPLLVDAMRRTVHALAPGARLVPLQAPPVVGAVMLGMEQAGLRPGPEVRQTLIDSYFKLVQ